MNEMNYRYLFISIVFAFCMAVPAHARGGDYERLKGLLWRGEYREASQVLNSMDGMLHSIYRYESSPDSLLSISDMATFDILPFLYSSLSKRKLSIMAVGSDSIALGLSFYSEGSFSSSLKCLSGQVENPYKEVYRKFYLARALAGSSRPEDALRVLKGIFLDRSQRSLLRTVPIHNDAVELMVQLSLECKNDIDEVIDLMGGGIVTPEPHLLLCDALIERGAPKKAREQLIEALQLPVDTSSCSLYSDCMNALIEKGIAFSGEELLELSRTSIELGLFDEARIFMRFLAKRKGYKYRYKLLEARYIAAKGKKEEARRVLKRIFRSKAAVEIKKEALWRIASIDFSLGDLKKSASNYKIFAFYYPHDSRSLDALDTAARICIKLGNERDAMRLLKEIVIRKPNSNYAEEAILSMVALDVQKGRETKALSILKSFERRTRRRNNPAILYWRYRLERNNPAGAESRDKLISLYPFSAYSFAVEEGKIGSGYPGLRSTADSMTLIAMENREKALINRLFYRCKTLDFNDYRFSLLRSLIRAGRLKEGAEIARSFIKQFPDDEKLLLSIYLYSRSIGMVQISIKAILALLDGEKGYRDFWALQYPVCYTDHIESSAEKWSVPRRLLLAFIREESSFDPNARSSVGALGLMQIMPRTGEWIFSRLGLKVDLPKALTEPSLSIKAGAWNLSRLLRISHGSIVGAAALYNAGEGKMKAWMKRTKPWKDELLSIELIGPRETRRFARRVVNSFSVYKRVTSAEAGM